MLARVLGARHVKASTRAAQSRGRGEGKGFFLENALTLSLPGAFTPALSTTLGTWESRRVGNGWVERSIRGSERICEDRRARAKSGFEGAFAFPPPVDVYVVCAFYRRGEVRVQRGKV